MLHFLAVCFAVILLILVVACVFVPKHKDKDWNDDSEDWHDY